MYQRELGPCLIAPVIMALVASCADPAVPERADAAEAPDAGRTHGDASNGWDDIDSLRDDEEGPPCAWDFFDLFTAPNPYFTGNNSLDDVVHIGVGHGVRVAATHWAQNRSGHRSRRYVSDLDVVDDTIARVERIDDSDFDIVGVRAGVTELTVRSCDVRRTLRVRVHEPASWQVTVALSMRAARGPDTPEGPTSLRSAALDTSRVRDVVIGDDVTISVGILPLSQYDEPLRGSIRDGAPELDLLRERSGDVDPDHMVFTVDEIARGDLLAIPLGPGPDPPLLRLEVAGYDDVASVRLELGDPPIEAEERTVLLLDPTPPDDETARYADVIDSYRLAWLTPPVRAVLTDDQERPILGFQDELSWSSWSRPFVHSVDDASAGAAWRVPLEGYFEEPPVDGGSDGVPAPRFVVEPGEARVITWSWGDVQLRTVLVTALQEAP